MPEGVRTDNRKAANELVRQGMVADRHAVTYRVEDLGAGADIAARAVFRAPAALTVMTAHVVHEGASAGVDGSNTAVLTLRNITQSVDVATVTLSADVAANAASTLAITAANSDVAAGDVLGVVVTQGATANLAAHSFVFSYRVDACNVTLRNS